MSSQRQVASSDLRRSPVSQCVCCLVCRALRASDQRIAQLCCGRSRGRVAVIRFSLLVRKTLCTALSPLVRAEAALLHRLGGECRAELVAAGWSLQRDGVAQDRDRRCMRQIRCAAVHCSRVRRSEDTRQGSKEDG